MDFLSNLGKKITETAKTVTEKSENLVEVTKLNLAIGNEEDKIKKMFTEMGSELYKNFLNGEAFGDHFNSKCEAIKEMEENITKLREKVLSLKGNKACVECSEVVDAEVKYCPNCGNKTDGTNNE